MPKGKKYFTTALAAVKVKNVAKKAASKRRGDKVTEKQSSSSESEYSSSEYSSDDDENRESSSYSSDDDEKIIQPSQTNNKQHPASISKPSSAVLDDDSSDSSESEFGCGVYRRREDLTPDSSVASSSGEESSYESESESESESGSSQYSTSQHSESQASSSEEESEHHSSDDDDDEPQGSESLSNKDVSKSSNTTSEQQVEDTTNSKKKSFFTKRPSFSGAAKNAVAPSKLRRPSTDSHGSQESTSQASRSSKASEPSKSSKGSKVSESSKKKNRRLSFGAAARTAVATAKMKKIKGKSSNKGIASESDEESVSSSSSEESKSSVESYPSSKISERSKGSKYADEESLASSKVSRKSRSSETSRSSKASKSNSSKVDGNHTGTPSLLDEDQMSMMRRGGSASGKGTGRDKSGKPPLGQAKSKLQVTTEDSDEDESDDVFGSLLQKARNMKSSKMSNDTNETNYGPDAMDKYKDSADLSHSFKTKSLQNANANLCNSFSEEKTNNMSHANGVGASRFASMMKDLKSSSDAKTNSSPSNESQGNEDKSEDDDGHMFEAPTIVPEDDVPVEQDDDTEHDDKNRQEEQKSRFRTRSESMKKLLHSKSDIADEDEESSETTEGSEDESEEGSDVEVDDGESDEDSTEENPEESMRTASSGEELNTGSGTFDDGSSDEYSTEDEDEDGYYEDEPAMTILTPITEVDNETFASTINPRARRKTTDGTADDDSLEEFNAAISPNPSDVLTEQKSDDREESDQSSEGTSHSSDSQASINSGHKNETTEGSQPNGQHETLGTNGINKNIQANGVSNKTICEYSSMPNVERLNMTEVIARIKSNDPNFKAINLDDADLNDFNATRLIVSLNDNKHITHLSLAQNRLGDGSAASLARVLRDNENMIYLCLRDNQIGNRGAKAMGDVLEENRTLSYLDLHGNDISPALLETVERRSNPQAPPPTIAPLTLNGEENKFPPSANGNCKDDDSSNNAVEKGRNSSTNGPVESHHSCETSQSAHSSFDSNVLETTAKAENASSTPLNGEDLLDINESGSASTREIFETAINSSIESGSRSVEDDALLQALSLALSNLDSEWELNTTDNKTLGDRRRIAPWKLECSHNITGPVVDTGEAEEEQQP